jgi:ribosomal protein S18 acetylase RimI-like enzyme
MGSGDAERVSEVIVSAIRASFAGYYSDEVTEALISGNTPDAVRGHAPKQMDFVYERGGRIAAMIGIKKNEIGHLFVDPAGGRRGIGRRLVDFAVAHMLARRYADLFVLSSLNAVGFYERCGFVREREGSFDVRPGLPLAYVRLSKEISAASGVRSEDGEDR